MRTLVLIAVVAALAGCHTQKSYSWSHWTKGPQQFNADNAKCLAMGGSVAAPAQYQANADAGPGGQGVVSGLNMGNAAKSNRMRNDIYNQCMKGEGWYLTAGK